MAAEGWTYQRLHDSIRKGQVHSLYYFYGDETFLIDESLTALVEMALGQGLRDLNLNTFYGSEAEVSQIREAIETLPMMASSRVVVLKEAQDLSDKDWEFLLPLIENPVDMTTFICVATKADKRKKFIKRFMENGVVIEFQRPYENQIPEWIHYIGRKHGLMIEDDAASVIQQLVGANLSDLNSEISKLAQFLGQRTDVRIDDVLTVISRVRLDSVFDLTDAIGNNDRAKALYCLANLLEHGQNEIGVLAMISRHVRILKLVNDGMREGLSGQRLSAKAGVSPRFLGQYAAQGRQWNQAKIERTFRALLETDRALKSSPIASHIWLENFILQTCSA